MRKAKDILMAQGFSDTDATALLTANPNLGPALEKEEQAYQSRVQNYERDVNDYKTKLKNTEDWYNNTALPTINKATSEAVKARAEHARLQAQLEAEQEMGLRRVASTDEAEAIRQREEQRQAELRRQQNQPGQGELDVRYVSADVFRQTTDQVGYAIAIAQDIADDHFELTGKRLPGGVKKLREDFMAARKDGFSGDMEAYADKQFKFSELRAAQADKARQDQEAQIRADERSKIMSEMMNPNTRQFASSRSPFIKGKIEGGTVDEKQPWERSREQRHSARVMTFGQKVLNDVNGGRRSA